MADDLSDLFGGLGSMSDIGEENLVSTGPTAGSTGAIDMSDFATNYAGVEQFQGKEAADQWALSNASDYGLDLASVKTFLEEETFNPSAMINIETDFTVGGTDTDLDKEGFQASNPGELIVTGDIDVPATITYPDNVDIFGDSAGATVTAAQEFGTPELVIGEPVSGTGGITVLNPTGVSFPTTGFSPLNDAYNILAANSANVFGAGDAARDIGNGIDGATWINMYEDVLPPEYVKMVANAFGIEWNPKEEEEEEEDTTTIIDDGSGGSDIVVIPGSGAGATNTGGITTVAEGPGGSYPNLGYYTDEGYGPYFTPDSSFSSLTPFVSPNTGKTLANLYDVGVNPNQFLGGPPTSTTNQPLSSFGYSEDTFAPSVGGIFNLDNFKNLNVKGLTFANYQPITNTSVITGGGDGGITNIPTGTGGPLIGGNTNLTGGTTINTGGTNTSLNPDVTVDYDNTIEDDTVEFDDGSITGNPLGDLVLAVGAGNLLESGFSAFANYWAGESSTGVVTGTPVPWGADVTSSNQNLLSTYRKEFDTIYNNPDAYKAWVDAGNTGTLKEYNDQVQQAYLDRVQNEFGNEVMVGEETTISQRQANGVYKEPQETETQDNNQDGDADSTNIFDDFNYTGDAGSFLAGLQTIGFDGFTPGGTTGVEFLDGQTKVTGKEGGFNTLVSDIVDINEGNIDLYPGSKIGDTLYIGTDGEALTGIAKLNAQASQALSTLTPDFVENAFSGITEAIPDGVKEGLKVFAQIGGGIDAYSNLVKFIDDPEPETALKTAAGVLAATGNFAAAIVVKGVAEVVDALFNGYDQQPHRTVYSNIDFDIFDPLSYSQADYDSDKAASEGVNMFMDGVGQLMSPELEALEEEYGVDIKGDLQLAYSDLSGFSYTIGNEDVTGFLERLDARDGGKDIPPYNMYRRNLGTFDFANPENLEGQLIQFKDTIISDIRKALDAGYTDFSDFHMIMKDINLGEEWERQKAATGLSDNELMYSLVGSVNPANPGSNSTGALISWAIRNGKTSGYIPGEALRQGSSVGY
tara:strand:+ start:229 stop:3327 length:3099 start_codon:yes stop_codon:yes gene_type:complete